MDATHQTRPAGAAGRRGGRGIVVGRRGGRRLAVGGLLALTPRAAWPALAGWEWIPTGFQYEVSGDQIIHPPRPGFAWRDRVQNLAYELVTAGQLEMAERIALAAEKPGENERTLLATLTAGADLPDERFDELEAHAVRVLRAYLDPARSGVRSRLEVARAASWGKLSFDTESGTLRAIAVLENAARTDPNS